MHWPVGIHAAIERQKELDRLKPDDTKSGPTEQESISSVIDLKWHNGVELEENTVGEEVGDIVGVPVEGDTVGVAVSDRVGAAVGDAVSDRVGATLSSSESLRN